MNTLRREKIACSYFFAAPSLAYGLFTSRLPAIKGLANLDNADLGSILLFLGLSTFTGLLASNWLISRCGAKKVTGISALILCAGIVFSSLSMNFWQISLGCLITGLAVGFCDVGVNTLGIELELRYKSLHMSFLHGITSIGGVLGAISGAFFAWLGMSPFFNSLLILGIFILFWYMAFKNLVDWKEEVQIATLAWREIPVFVLILGLMSLFAHVAEGSAAEWGSVFLRTIKKAPESEAALAFAFFTGGMVIIRLYGDKLRGRMRDYRLCLYGSLMGTAAMILVLLAKWPWVCLAGYFLMGLGLGPLVPILFSRAGNVPGLTASRASAIISTFSYSGLLLFPPLLGYLAQKLGLVHALWFVVCCCYILIFGSFLIKRRDGGKK